MTRPGSGRPLSPEAAPPMVHLLALRPELREAFPLADQVDLWVRWSA